MGSPMEIFELSPLEDSDSDKDEASVKLLDDDITDFRLDHRPEEKCLECRQALSKVFKMSPIGTSISESESREQYIKMCKDRVPDQLPLAEYSLFDKNGHLVPLERSWQKKIDVFFQGYLKPPGASDEELGVPVVSKEPIRKWYATGYAVGEVPGVVISTDLQDYSLLEPAPEYADIDKYFIDRITLTKIVLEAIAASRTEDLPYEVVFHKVERVAVNVGIRYFSEELLTFHAEYIIGSVEKHAPSCINCRFIKKLKNNVIFAYGQTELPLKRKQVEKTKVPSAARPAPQRQFTEATTTPVVRHVFESVFKEQIKDNSEDDMAQSKRCGACDLCRKPECGRCEACKDMLKFGGEGRLRQKCQSRKCEQFEGGAPRLRRRKKKCRRLRPAEFAYTLDNVSYPETPLHTDLGTNYYNSVRIEGTEYTVGQTVLMKSMYEATPNFLARIRQIFRDGDQHIVHVQYFVYSNQTVLGETGNEREVFLLDDCEDIQMSMILKPVQVDFLKTPDDWQKSGGSYECLKSIRNRLENCPGFFVDKKYDPELAKFTNIEPMDETDDEIKGVCSICEKLDSMHKPVCALNPFNMPTNSYSSVRVHETVYRVGDAVYIDPRSFRMKFRMRYPKGSKKNSKRNEVMFTEFYRHRRSIRARGSNFGAPDPFRIGVIEKIRESSGRKRSVYVTVRVIYRHENTRRSKNPVYKADYHEVFWSEDTKEVNAKHIAGLCHVRPAQVLTQSAEDWAEGGSHRFYFSKVYRRKYIPLKDVKSGQEALDQFSNKARYPPDAGSYPVLQSPLNCLDVFSGCGGLSLGLEQSGVCKTKWAIENFAPAAEAFSLNHPDCHVINRDCNHILEGVMAGKQKVLSDQGRIPLPQKGDIDLICGGPPCQGFSSMNMFSEGEYSRFKNSLVVTFLSYLDFYRPRYFILENVQNFTRHKQGLILQLCIRTLTLLGYQCAFEVLQAGNFGIPQSRRRTIILAAAPGEVLPSHPKPLHTFTTFGSDLSVKLDKRVFKASSSRTKSSTRTRRLRRKGPSAPFRTITARDILTDLKKLDNGGSSKRYAGKPKTHFQKLVRLNVGKELHDHECRKLSPLSAGRICLIPPVIGSDWRDLPNIEVELLDGTFAKKLVYTHYDAKNRTWTGVCSCAGENGQCGANDRQINTLIPWHPVHTGNRNANWSGLYGRIGYDGLFSTVLTMPDPNSKQGHVVHPKQHRIMSVREFARAQGFPDDVKFAGKILDKHRQVGNSVPPPLARAIGREIVKALVKK